MKEHIKVMNMVPSHGNYDPIEELKKKINNLKRQWPKHSVPPAMVIALEDLEESLSQALREMDTNGDPHA